MTQRKPAFTLLELLVVIALLALLISILLPSLSAARRSAKANACLAHLKGIGHGFEIYLNENEDRFPPAQLLWASPGTSEPYINGFQRLWPRWQWFIETDAGPVINPVPYQARIRQVGFFDDQSIASPSGKSGTTMTNDVFTCPSLRDDEYTLDVRDGAYGYNYQYLGNARQNTVPSRWDNFPVGRHQIRNAGSTVLVADSRGAGRRHGRHSFTLDPPRLATERNATRFGPDGPVDAATGLTSYVEEGLDTNLYSYSPVELRHNRHGNVLFVDTHAEPMTLTELGYEFDNADGVPEKTPRPIRDPQTGTYTASNKLWTGTGVDTIAQEHRP